MFPSRLSLACCAWLSLAPLATLATAQSPPSLADLQWSISESQPARFLIVPGTRAMVAGYASPGLELWMYPLQLLHGYRLAFRLGDDTTDVDGPATLRTIEQTPTSTTRVYAGTDWVVRERLFTPVDVAAAAFTYTVESTRPVSIIVHFTPALDLMWPGGIGGQEIHWDSRHSAYILDEPSRRFHGAIASSQIVRHDEWQNTTRGGAFGRDFAFTLRAATSDSGARTISFAASTTPGEDPLAIAESLVSRARQADERSRARYAALHVVQIETPDSAVNRALRWAQVTLEQAWVCNPQLGCGVVAGYGPSRGVRRPQYAWFFANDGLVAVDALLREGAGPQARAELAFIMQYQNAHTGAIWHELSQSAGFLDWRNAYPYMYVHVDVSFDFLEGVRDYVQTTGDVAFANDHWTSIVAAYRYCRSTIPEGEALPIIPAGQQGRDEQDPQRDELSLSLAWISAAESFATLARVTHHDALVAGAHEASTRARGRIRGTYYDAARGVWLSGHLRSGKPVVGLTAALIALLHHGLLEASEQRTLLDALASPSYRTAWGIRSTPSDAPEYDPDSYARGSVWALGTADAIMAFYEAGRSETATALWRGLVPWFALDAPGHMHEVLRGDAFVPERESVPDQTWSASAFLSSAVRGTLGLTVDGAGRELRFAPRLPRDWDHVVVRRIDVGGSDVDLTMRTTGSVVDLTVDNAGPQLTLKFAPDGAGDTTVVCSAARTTRVRLARIR
jgi:glycogen debranching enzyme